VIPSAAGLRHSRGPFFQLAQLSEEMHVTGGSSAAVGNFKNILLADDSPDDVFLIKSAFKKGGFRDPIYVVANGEQALQYLKGEGLYADRREYPIPHLLLLDLNMPRLNGFEVLSWIRGRQEWMCLPVIVLTTSFYGPEIKRAYDLGANSFITKPPEFSHLVASLKEFGEHWLRRAILPEPGPFIPSPAQTPSSVSKTGKLVRAKSRAPKTRNSKVETRNKLKG
jgi:CheY-like chemotaxis protein